MASGVTGEKMTIVSVGIRIIIVIIVVVTIVVTIVVSSKAGREKR